jgi:hypothetical protein
MGGGVAVLASPKTLPFIFEDVVASPAFLEGGHGQFALR